MDLLNHIFDSFYSQIVEGDISLRFDIFESNIINLAILVGGLVYLLSGSLSESLSERQKKVVGGLDQSFYKLEEAAEAFLNEEDRLELVQFSTEFIRRDGQKMAEQIKSTILSDGNMEIERLSAATKAQISTIEARARKQILDYVAKLALNRVVQKLEGQLDLAVQKQIIERNISKLVE
jgi:F-type H+-transporting ATPase subunit b